jgi:hypothetical protein
MHFVVAFRLNICNFFWRKFAHANALDPVVELSVDSAANGTHERAEVEHNRLRPFLGAVKTFLVAANLLHGADAINESFLLLCLSHYIVGNQSLVHT